MIAVRLLSGPEAVAAIPALSEVLSDCVNDDASVGFMKPYGVADAEPYWADVARAVASGATVLLVAEVDGVQGELAEFRVAHGGAVEKLENSAVAQPLHRIGGLRG